MERVLRMPTGTSPAVQGEEVSVKAERAVRIDKGAEIGALVDRLYGLKQRLKAKEAAHKADTEAMAIQIKELTAELQTYAETHQKTSVVGREVTAKFSPAVARKIDPAKLLAFLQKFGKITEFWKLVKVQIGDATKQYGEAVLEAEGVLTVEKVEYGNIKFVVNADG